MKLFSIAAMFIIAFQFLNCQKGYLEIEGGKIKGVAEEGLTVYKGIPFAAPPMGSLRWRAPQAVIPWEGILEANTYGAICPQAPGLEPNSEELNTSEDCLYLNIWTPAKSAEEKLPVMVWIHGGGFAVGSPSRPFNNGRELAKMGVVVVNLSYRLGPLGFLAHPELTEESSHKVSGNYGLLDQIHGLKWVQKNISAFGGDPNSVTIFGESAGGASVSILAGSPLAKGLFHKLISQSGGHFSPAKTKREWDSVQKLEGKEKAGLDFMERLGVKTLAELRDLPVAAWAKDPAAQIGGFGPNVDGYVIADDQYKLYEKGAYNDVPVLLGTNSDEGSMFTPPTNPDDFVNMVTFRFGPFAKDILKHYPAADAAEARQSMADIFGDTLFGWPSWVWARLQSRTGKSNVYMYYFNRENSLSPFPLPVVTNKAPHGAEMPFIYKKLDIYPTEKLNASDTTLMNNMASYWVNFAKSGNPNGEGLPNWDVFTEDNPRLMRFNRNSQMGEVANPQRLAVLDKYFAWKRTGVAAP